METITTQKFEILIDLEKKKPPKDTKFIISLLTPGLIIFTLIILIPIVIGIFLSFRIDFNLNNPFGKRFTLINYYQLIGYNNVYARSFWTYTYQTLFFSIVSLVIEFLLGLVFAMILNKNFKGRGIARATLLIPWAIPTVASATLFRFEILNSAQEFGLINSIIQLFGGTPVYFYGTGLAPVLFNIPVLVSFPPFISEVEITMTMFSVIMIDVWKTTPFITLLILASLQIVPEDLYKAGDIAGASGWQKFRYITWPLIKPGVGIALIFRMMQSLRVYDAVVVFNDQSVRSMTVQSYLFWSNTDYGLSSAVSIMILLFIIIFAFFILLFTKREKRTSSTPFLKNVFKKLRLKRNNPKKKDQVKKEIPLEYSKEKIPLPKKISLDQDLTDLIGESVKLKPISPTKIKLYINIRRLKKIVFILLVIIMIFFCAGPFLWILLKSFRDPTRAPGITQTQFEWIPKYFSLRAYQIIFEQQGYFAHALLNSVILAGSTVILILIVGSLIAYAIAKFNFPFKRGLNGFIFSMNSLPALIIIIPFYQWIIAISRIIPPLDIRNTLYGLILPYTAINLPLAIFILIAFFKEIPEDLWKAAKVDGATNFQIFRKVILPLTIPGIFTCAILVFIACWNELLFAQVFLQSSESNHTIPLAILQFVRNPGSITRPWNTDIALMAATSVATIPLIIVVLIFQKKIVSGLTRGAVKG